MNPASYEGVLETFLANTINGSSTNKLVVLKYCYIDFYLIEIIPPTRNRICRFHFIVYVENFKMRCKMHEFPRSHIV